MKKILLGSLVFSVLLSSCGKDGDDEDTTPAENYLHTTAGSTWNYRSVNNLTATPPQDYTRTSTSRDTVINTRTYHIYTNSSTGASEYNGKSNNDYWIYQSLPDQLGGTQVDVLYLKAAASVNASWVQNFPLAVSSMQLTGKLINKVVEKGISKTVNGLTYNNVIHIKTDIEITGLPPGVVTFSTDIHQYYAPQVGLIQSDTKISYDLLGTVTNTDMTTTLQSSNLL